MFKNTVLEIPSDILFFIFAFTFIIIFALLINFINKNIHENTHLNIIAYKNVHKNVQKNTHKNGQNCRICSQPLPKDKKAKWCLACGSPITENMKRDDLFFKITWGIVAGMAGIIVIDRLIDWFF
jgi:uncharacterized paraquat-inducible protein A